MLDGEIDRQMGELAIDVIFPGEMFREMALTNVRPCSATVIARTPSSFVAIDENRFNFLVRQAPNFALMIMPTLVGRLREINKPIGDR